MYNLESNCQIFHRKYQKSENNIWNRNFIYLFYLFKSTQSTGQPGVTQNGSSSTNYQPIKRLNEIFLYWLFLVPLNTLSYSIHPMLFYLTEIFHCWQRCSNPVRTFLTEWEQESCVDVDVNIRIRTTVCLHPPVPSHS